MASHGTRDADSLAARLERHGRVSTALAALGDPELGALVTAAPTLGSGIGGTRAALHVAGATVFVKRVPLTDLERRPENVRSTANLFGLPLGCQYGVGDAPSFGAWREVAANEMATGQVLAGRQEGFALLYHWRVLDGPASQAPLPEELADMERVIARWNGSAAVRDRIESLARSSATVTLFLEFVPHLVSDWLAREMAGGAGPAAGAAIEMVERGLRTEVAAMNAAGLFHFDAHLGNVLTDGRRVYLADFGLATSPRFRLSAGEAAFVAAHGLHDLCLALTGLVDCLVTELTAAPDWRARNETIRRVADGEALVGVLPAAAAVIARYAPVAVVVNEFYRRLYLVDRGTPYPEAELRRAWAASGVEVPGA